MADRKRMENEKLVCYECNGKGGWEDPIAQQSVICPVCRPRAAEAYAFEHCDLPGFITSRWRERPAKWYGPLFQAPPWLLVVHCPVFSNRVASYFEDPMEKGEPRKVSAHLAYEEDRYDQCVALNRVANHCGGSRYRGQGKLNYCSHGIECVKVNTPYSSVQKDQTRASLVYLMEANPVLRVAVPHSFIDPSRGDPGKHFPWEVFDGLGLELPHTI